MRNVSAAGVSVTMIRSLVAQSRAQAVWSRNAP